MLMRRLWLLDTCRRKEDEEEDEDEDEDEMGRGRRRRKRGMLKIIMRRRSYGSPIRRRWLQCMFDVESVSAIYLTLVSV